MENSFGKLAIALSPIISITTHNSNSANITHGIHGELTGLNINGILFILSKWQLLSVWIYPKVEHFSEPVSHLLRGSPP